MKGFRLHSWDGILRWDEFDVAPPGPGEVALSVEACGVGLTVFNCLRGDLADDPQLLPRVPGHEIVGRVTAVGPGGLEQLLGERVVAYFYLSCTDCLECRAGHDARCRNLAGLVGVHIDGGYAPRVVLPAANVISVPESLDPIAATVVPDAVATSLHVTRARARVRPGDRVVVIGAGGGVGAHLVQVAGMDGAEVVGLDVGEDKLAMIRELGYRAVRSEDFSALSGDGLFEAGSASVVVDLVGSDASLSWALAALGPGGRLVVLTTFRDRSFSADPRRLVFQEAAIIGSRYASKREVATAAELVASGTVRPIIGRVVAAPAAGEIHEQLEAGTLVGRGALDWRKSA